MHKRKFVKSKKGFGSIVSTLIMFIAVVSVSVGLVIAFKNYVATTQNSLNVQNQLASNSLKTKISIINIVYNQSSNISIIYLKNIGQTVLYTKNFDLFINKFFMANFSKVNPSNFSQNVTILNPQNTVAIIKDYHLNSGTYPFKVVSGYGVSDSTSVNI